MWKQRHDRLAAAARGATREPIGAWQFVALTAFLVAIALGGCAQQNAEKKEQPNIFPADYRAAIVKQLKDQLEDPTGIRDAYIAEPTMRSRGSIARYVACLRFNAKDRDGNYVGSKDYAAFFFAGQLNQIADATPELCGGASYQPFPELQKLCREAVCKP